MNLIKRTAFKIANSLGVSRIGRRATRDSILILMFHGFCDQRFGGLTNYDGKHLEISRFARFLDYLARRHNVVKLDDVVSGSGGQGLNNDLPANAVVLTFDDGYQSNYRLAFPELVKRDLPATIFLATEFVDEKKPMWPDRVEFAVGNSSREAYEFSGANGGDRYSLSEEGDRKRCLIDLKRHLKSLPMESVHGQVATLERELDCSLSDSPDAPDVYAPLHWDEVREMADSGLISIGAHTHSHKILGRSNAETIEYELSNCQEVIREKADLDPHLFCYPNGQPGDFNAETGKALRKHGFNSGLTTVFGWNRADSDAYALKRMGISNDWSPTYFELMVSGTIPKLKRQL